MNLQFFLIAISVTLLIHVFLYIIEKSAMEMIPIENRKNAIRNNIFINFLIEITIFFSTICALNALN